VIGVPPAGARGTRPSGRSFAVARHPLSGAVGCPSGCRLDSVQDVDAAAKEPTCVIARKTRKSSKVSKLCDEPKSGRTRPFFEDLRARSDASRMTRSPAARVCQRCRLRRVAKASFHELFWRAGGNFVGVRFAADPQHASV